MQKAFEVQGPAAVDGAAKLSKTAKDKQSDTPSTLPEAGAADLKGCAPCRRPPALVSKILDISRYNIKM